MDLQARVNLREGEILYTQKDLRHLEGSFGLIPEENKTHLETTEVSLQHNGQSSSQRRVNFPRKEKIPEGGRDQTDILGLG